MVQSRRRLARVLVGLVFPVFARAYRKDVLPGWQGEHARAGESTQAELAAECHVQEHTELWGEVVKWGSGNIQDTAEGCCAQCRAHNQQAAQGNKPCNTWVWCADAQCGQSQQGECWLKHSSNPTEATVQASGELTPWTSGVLLTAEQARVKAAKDAEVAAVRDNRVNNPRNPRVWFDIEIDGQPVGRIDFVLYMEEAPRSAENFRALCTGEKGMVPPGHEGAGKRYHFKGNAFYRIIDQFIDQAGANTDSVFGGTFKDDEGGLKIKHDRAGLLSMANAGPDSNTSHFSILMNAAPHLNGKYTVFGEVVSGLDVALKMNKLANKNRDTSPLGKAIIADSGQYPV